MFQHDNLRIYMALGNHTGREIAAVVGVSPMSVYNWMNGRTAPRGETVMKLAEYFKITPSIFYSKLNIVV